MGTFPLGRHRHQNGRTSSVGSPCHGPVDEAAGDPPAALNRQDVQILELGRPSILEPESRGHCGEADGSFSPPRDEDGMSVELEIATDSRTQALDRQVESLLDEESLGQLGDGVGVHRSGSLDAHVVALALIAHGPSI